MSLFFIAIIVFIFNIPFGYWRANVKRFSLQWFMAIHLPVPFIIMLRLTAELGFEIITYAFLIAAFFLGQITGDRIFMKMKTSSPFPLTSCLCMDYFRLINSAY